MTNGQAPFAAVLKRAMDDRGLSGSELARRVWGTQRDVRGYEVAKNRASVSQYLSGAMHPSPATLKKIADVLALPVSDLTASAAAPEQKPEPPASRLPEDDLRLSAVSTPGKVRLRVNRVIDRPLALKIFEMLS